MASHHVPRRNFNSGRFFAGANFFGVDTAGSKAASRLGFDGRRNFSFQKNSLSLHINVRNGNGRKQCLGIGMGRMLEKLFTRAEFHDFTQIHYHDIGGNVLVHRQIVGNEQISQGSLLLEILHQIQDLGLYRYIQSRYRLIAYDELGVQSQGPGNTNALAAATVQFMGIGSSQIPGKSHGFHQVEHSLAACFPVFCGFVDPVWLRLPHRPWSPFETGRLAQGGKVL